MFNCTIKILAWINWEKQRKSRAD